MNTERDYSIYWIHLAEHDMFSGGYIGISKDVESRWKAHSNTTENPHLKAALNKYKDSVIWEVIADDLTEDEAKAYEKLLRPVPNIGWNIAAGGGMPPRFADFSEESKERLRNAARKTGLNQSPEHIEAFRLRSINKTEAHKNAIKEANKRTAKTPEWKSSVLRAVANRTQEHKENLKKSSSSRSKNRAHMTKDQQDKLNATSSERLSKGYKPLLDAIAKSKARTYRHTETGEVRTAIRWYNAKVNGLGYKEFKTLLVEVVSE